MRPDTYRKRVLKIPKPVAITKFIAMFAVPEYSYKGFYERLRDQGIGKIVVLNQDLSCCNPQALCFIKLAFEIEKRVDASFPLRLEGFKGTTNITYGIKLKKRNVR